MPATPELSLNERRLVELIFKNKGVARVELAQLSGMTGATVTRLIASLLDLGLITEEPDRSGAQGQPRRLLQLQARRFLPPASPFPSPAWKWSSSILAARFWPREVWRYEPAGRRR
ncbi:winged helix-turn-helix transcriptional regulator [Ensifer aridi]|uniref:winged helix-turn-helix transcriptional regulator n=1 Tax=Ensifer aridi TaxID=1708715 RepID=UPI00358DE603